MLALLGLAMVVVGVTKIELFDVSSLSTALVTVGMIMLMGHESCLRDSRGGQTGQGCFGVGDRDYASRETHNHNEQT